MKYFFVFSDYTSNSKTKLISLKNNHNIYFIGCIRLILHCIVNNDRPSGFVPPAKGSIAQNEGSIICKAGAKL